VFFFFHETDTKMTVQHSVSLKRVEDRAYEKSVLSRKGMTLTGELGFPEMDVDC